MATPGFTYFDHAKPKADGTQQRMEQNAAGDMLKKYTRPDGSTFSGVQMAGESRPAFLARINSTDVMEGFRRLL